MGLDPVCMVCMMKGVDPSPAEEKTAARLPGCAPTRESGIDGESGVAASPAAPRFRISDFLYRHRFWLFLFLYLMGFYAQPIVSGAQSTTLWLACSALLARTGWIGLEAATYSFTAAALILCALGAALRLAGAGYGAPRPSAAGPLSAAGPYRRLRSPLQLGNSLLAAAISILMPAFGAMAFLVSFLLLQLLLGPAEDRVLGARLGGNYREYRDRVPRLLPALSARAPDSGVKARWPQALIAELWPLSFSVCFAVFAWRFNAQILIRCLLICCGAALIGRAILAQPRDSE